MLKVFPRNKDEMSVGRSLSAAFQTVVARCVTSIGSIMHIVFYVICKLTFQKENCVLTYHSVSSDNDFFAVDPNEFRRHIDYLRKNYAVVSLNEIVDFIKERRDLPRKAVAITFDDGYYDFYVNAYPYFRQNKLPATIFVTTRFVGKEWPLSNLHSKMLTWEEIEEISKNNIEIGAHTVTHPNLQEIGLKESEFEILGSKREIEEHIGKNVNFFSYPFGRARAESINIVRSSGFKGGLGGAGTIRKDNYVFVLNRVQVDSSVSFMLFKARLTKAVDWYKRFEQTARLVLNRFPFKLIVYRIYYDLDGIDAGKHERPGWHRYGES